MEIIHTNRVNKCREEYSRQKNDFQKKSTKLSPIWVQCSISTLPENIRKPLVYLKFSADIEIEHWAKMS